MTLVFFFLLLFSVVNHRRVPAVLLLSVRSLICIVFLLGLVWYDMLVCQQILSWGLVPVLLLMPSSHPVHSLGGLIHISQLCYLSACQHSMEALHLSCHGLSFLFSKLWISSIYSDMLTAAHSCLRMDTHRFRNRYELYVHRFTNGVAFHIGKFFQVTDLLLLNQPLWCYHSDMYLKITWSSLAGEGSQHILQFICKAIFFFFFNFVVSFLMSAWHVLYVILLERLVCSRASLFFHTVWYKSILE